MVNVESILDYILLFDKGESLRFIDFSFKNEVKIGISGAVEYHSISEYKLNIIKMFSKIQSSSIEKTIFQNEQTIYKVYYNLIRSNEQKEVFGTHIS